MSLRNVASSPRCVKGESILFLNIVLFKPPSRLCWYCCWCITNSLTVCISTIFDLSAHSLWARGISKWWLYDTGDVYADIGVHCNFRRNACEHATYYKMGDSKAQHGTQEMKGWLFKWTNYLKGYQRRWFVLSNGLLSYYR